MGVMLDIYRQNAYLYCIFRRFKRCLRGKLRACALEPDIDNPRSDEGVRNQRCHSQGFLPRSGVFRPDLGFWGFFLETQGFSWGFSKNLGFFWGFVRFPRKIHILECFLLESKWFLVRKYGTSCCFFSFWSVKGKKFENQS